MLKIRTGTSLLVFFWLVGMAHASPLSSVIHTNPIIKPTRAALAQPECRSTVLATDGSSICLQGDDNHPLLSAYGTSAGMAETVVTAQTPQDEHGCQQATFSYYESSSPFFPGNPYLVLTYGLCLYQTRIVSQSLRISTNLADYTITTSPSGPQQASVRAVLTDTRTGVSSWQYGTMNLNDRNASLPIPIVQTLGRYFPNEISKSSFFSPALEKIGVLGWVEGALVVIGVGTCMAGKALLKDPLPSTQLLGIAAMGIGCFAMPAFFKVMANYTPDDNSTTTQSDGTDPGSTGTTGVAPPNPNGQNSGDNCQTDPSHCQQAKQKDH